MRQESDSPGTKGGVGGSMAYYRLYRLAEPGGRFVDFEEIEAADDADATRQAEAYAGAQALELWCGKRKVKSFAPVEK